jgi:hypothetical protein
MRIKLVRITSGGRMHRHVLQFINSKMGKPSANSSGGDPFPSWHDFC